MGIKLLRKANAQNMPTSRPGRPRPPHAPRPPLSGRWPRRRCRPRAAQRRGRPRAPPALPERRLPAPPRRPLLSAAPEPDACPCFLFPLLKRSCRVSVRCGEVLQDAALRNRLTGGSVTSREAQAAAQSSLGAGAAEVGGLDEPELRQTEGARALPGGRVRRSRRDLLRQQAGAALSLGSQRGLLRAVKKILRGRFRSPLGRCRVWGRGLGKNVCELEGATRYSAGKPEKRQIGCQWSCVPCSLRFGTFSLSFQRRSSHCGFPAAAWCLGARSGHFFSPKERLCLKQNLLKEDRRGGVNGRHVFLWFNPRSVPWSLQFRMFREVQVRVHKTDKNPSQPSQVLSVRLSGGCFTLRSARPCNGKGEGQGKTEGFFLLRVTSRPPFPREAEERGSLSPFKRGGGGGKPRGRRERGGGSRQGGEPAGEDAERANQMAREGWRAGGTERWLAA
ncbi:uncharacterized protein LOC135575822 [Columba livia]|uniref:uncharacterized protein LOC135575822 n=1 Tax=Columba livia TaxID=8932 RepID=UPI0031BACCE5